jgi:hypothetical protein
MIFAPVEPTTINGFDVIAWAGFFWLAQALLCRAYRRRR